MTEPSTFDSAVESAAHTINRLNSGRKRAKNIVVGSIVTAIGVPFMTGIIGSLFDASSAFPGVRVLAGAGAALGAVAGESFFRSVRYMETNSHADRLSGQFPDERSYDQRFYDIRHRLVAARRRGA